MATGYLGPDAFQRVITALSVVAPGAKLYTYLTGTSTPSSIYSDRALTTATANPLVADSGGLFAAFFLDPTIVYRFTLKTSADVTIAGPIDGIQVNRGGSGLTYLAKTGTYTAIAGDLVDCTTGTFTVTLPSAAANANTNIGIVNNGTGTITVGRTGSDTIGLATSQTVNPAVAGAQGDSFYFISDGVSNWVIL